jgi:DNA-binding MarR family transcriptional regulator
MAERAPPHPEAFKELGERFNDPALKSSTRILILISLALNRRMSVVRILRLTGMEKGSISNHLKKLEASGYIATKTSKTFGGYRTTVEITEKGLTTCIELLDALSKLKQSV